MSSLQLDQFEEEAIDAASEAGGAYLESLGKFDISLLSPSEWRMFLAKTFVAATDRVRELRADEEVPF